MEEFNAWRKQNPEATVAQAIPEWCKAVKWAEASYSLRFHVCRQLLNATERNIVEYAKQRLREGEDPTDILLHVQRVSRILGSIDADLTPDMVKLSRLTKQWATSEWWLDLNCDVWKKLTVMFNDAKKLDAWGTPNTAFEGFFRRLPETKQATLVERLVGRYSTESFTTIQQGGVWKDVDEFILGAVELGQRIATMSKYDIAEALLDETSATTGDWLSDEQKVELCEHLLAGTHWPGDPPPFRGAG